MFFPVKSKDGKTAFINADLIFAFVDNGPAETVAVSSAGATFVIPEKLETVMEDFADYMEAAEDGD